MNYIESNEKLIELVHYLQNKFCNNTKWFGVECVKNPLDFWVYQEIIYSMQPTVILEIGNWKGGSALAMAHLLDIQGSGRVIAVDINHENVDPRARAHPRITWIEGDATDPEIEQQIRALISAEDRVLIIEDSDHVDTTVNKLLHMYKDLVRVGDYFIVEDSVCGFKPLNWEPDPGPWAGITRFLEEDPNWESDREQEKYIVTWNPLGFLRRRS
jgi:cephalosporin hydroxylase